MKQKGGTWNSVLTDYTLPVGTLFTHFNFAASFNILNIKYLEEPVSRKLLGLVNWALGQRVGVTCCFPRQSLLSRSFRSFFARVCNMWVVGKTTSAFGKAVRDKGSLVLDALKLYELVFGGRNALSAEEFFVPYEVAVAVTHGSERVANYFVPLLFGLFFQKLRLPFVGVLNVGVLSKRNPVC